MNNTGLTEQEIDAMHTVFRQVGAIRTVLLFGSRAKGSFRPESDIDLALVGVANALEAEAVAEALESLPLPYRFDVKAYDSICYLPLLEHIKRVGVPIYQQETE
ncbi:MAG: nucleotidyltransferase domain-containing protein [Magnetococcales bacterium]|nr:nucleotidyltransferase domain-containing protein [Magnetococcales bacterium]